MLHIPEYRKSDSVISGGFNCLAAVAKSYFKQNAVYTKFDHAVFPFGLDVAYNYNTNEKIVKRFSENYRE